MSKEQKYVKDFRLEIKEVTEEGTFTGVLSVYDVVDLGGDLIEKGAFTKTLAESGGEIPCLWQHREPIGRLKIADTDDGLEVKGTLVLEVQQGREALALMKARVVRGLSIGYRTVKSRIEEGVRRLKEVELFEGSVVTFPMMPLAQITSVKADEQKGDFSEELDRMQTFMMRHLMLDSISNSLDSIAWDSEMSAAEKVTASDESIEQFRKAYVSFLPRLLALWGEKAVPPEGQKAGRTISAATAARIKEAIDLLSALLDPEAAGTLPAEGKAAGTKTAGADDQKGGEPPPQGAEIHSLLESFARQRRAAWTRKN